VALSEVIVDNVFVTLEGGLNQKKFSGKTKLLYKGNIINGSKTEGFDPHKDLMFDCECEYENWSSITRLHKKKSFSL